MTARWCSLVYIKLEMPLMDKHAERSNVTGNTANPYKMVKVCAMLDAAPVNPTSCSKITEFCAGGMHPSMRMTKLKIARAGEAASPSNESRSNPNKKAKAQHGAKTNREKAIVPMDRTDKPGVAVDDSPLVAFFCEAKLPAKTKSAAGKYAVPKVCKALNKG